ncbi:MAG: MBL fold metallo-hydrolase [Candidatus Aenigmatarchaeota archaeon]|nr:MBL fold metallo-hydrolase [Candidatus Aenigmarchaeota archaeon]
MGIVDNLSWFGHASFSIEDKIGKKFYFIDPFDLKRLPSGKADAIFVTHAHYDHWSPNDIRKLLKPDTTVIATNGCENLNLPSNAFMIVEPDRTFTIAGIRVKTVPAYNVKPERLNYHPKENKWVGYIFEINESRIYHAGDTDFIPEMKNLVNIDVAMLPIGGTYTMDVKEAIQAANTIQAGVTIPMHYRRLLGNKAKAAEEEFKSGVKGKVVVMKELS